MLVLDSAYTHKMLVERNLTAMVTSRDLNGFFDHVWACHPIASLLEPEAAPERFGRLASYRLATRHTLIEGRIGRFRALAGLSRLNFLIAQAGLFVRLLGLVLGRRISIIRCEDPLYMGLLGLMLARLTARPLVVGVWGNLGALRRETGQPLMKRLFNTVSAEERLERFVLRRADLVIVQNEDNRNFVLGRGVPIERTAIFRLGNALDPAHFTEPVCRPDGHPKLEALQIRDGTVLLVISRLERVKLVDHVLHALALLKSRGRRAVVLFVGDGSQKAELEALATELGVTNDVVFAGNQSQGWLAEVIPTVDVVVSPLTGRALGEAALGGAPTVAYDLDWQGEIVITGETGELVAAHDFGSMTDAIERLLDNPERARRMGAELRRKAWAMLNPEQGARMQAETYRALLRGSWPLRKQG